jgi:SAM-dependent methyltransferase
MGILRRPIGALTHRSIRRSGECSTLIRWLAPGTGERILDVGCGDGYFTSVIADAGAEVTGIDVDPIRLRLAHSFYRHPRARILEVDAGAIDFPDASFDKGISFCVIEHLPDDDQVLAHLARVIKPGGLLVLSADSLSNDAVTPAEREAHRTRYAVRAFHTRESLGEKLSRAGFDLLESRYLLTTPFSLRLIRWSWALDALRWPARIVRSPAHFLLATVGKALSDLSERRHEGADRGLTLLVRARRRGAPQVPGGGGPE